MTEGAGEPIWIVDDAPSHRFPLYTRGNVGEVFPTVVSPLTWSLFGEMAELGWRDAFTRFGVLVPADVAGERMLLLGVFGGYAYLNASYIRVLAVRTPGMTVADLDRQFFGESEAPPYVPRPGDRHLLASLRVGATLARTLLARTLPDLDADKQWVGSWMRHLPDPAGASDRDLLAILNGFRPMFRQLFGRHVLMTFQGQIGPGLLASLCTGRLGDPTLPTTLLAGIGDVESAAPSVALWDLGRLVAASPVLTGLFDRGLDGLGLRLAAATGGAAEQFRAGFAAFIAEHGCRGPNEWEGAAAVWATHPATALAAIDRLRGADPGHDPRRQQERLRLRRVAATDAARAALRAPQRLQLDLALRSAQLFSQGRERSKTTVIRALHAVRLAQRELARRGRDRGGPDDLTDLWLLTIGELPAYLADPASFAEVLDARRATRDRLRGLEPPFVVDGQVPPIERWARRATQATVVHAGTTLLGISGCPGIARGRARVVLDPADPRGLGPGEVLVAPITDPSWTPLFLAADAVVVDVGAQLSHAVIVSRELGIPCVVSVTDATRSIPDGALVEVDGDRGQVRVLSV
ncbi:MAG: phosphoenolpyruvate-utilizing protein [Acidimicrobiales bacterium]|nr:phosphoenolpyruvate-utilizing protein [Acidimicrobiales bacterium]